MYGAVPFYQACVKHGIKPLIGMEITVSEPTKKGHDERFSLRLIAKSNKGYRRLLKLATMLGMKEDKEQFLTKQEWLAAEVTDCAIIIPYKQVFVSRWIKANSQRSIVQWIESWSGSSQTWYLELLLDGDETFQNQLVMFAEQENINVIAAKPIHYLNREDQTSYKLLRAIDLGIHPDQVELEEGSLPSTSEMTEWFHAFPQALQHSVELADSVNLSLQLDRQLPKYPLTSQSSSSYLRTLCEQGLHERYANQANKEAIKERLDYELSVIEDMGFNDYFLIVWDFMKFARNQGILAEWGVGRQLARLLRIACILHM